MYITRRLSIYQKDPSALSLPQPEGPNTGILVIQDEEAEPTCCFGLCGASHINDLPFPQNKELDVHYTTGTRSRMPNQFSTYNVVFIPVLNQPLSSNLYYAISSNGKNKGKAFINSTEDEIETCCCYSNYVPDTSPQVLDPHNKSQQFQISRVGHKKFVAKSVSQDGTPPNFLSRRGWKLQSSDSLSIKLQDDAHGLDPKLRARLPSSVDSTPVVVGKWYSPFVFIKERRLEDQVLLSMYYIITLEQTWERILTCENQNKEDDFVVVDANVDKEEVVLASNEIVGQIEVADGTMWFRSSYKDGRDAKVGLSLEIVEQMKWEATRFGWVEDGEKRVRLKREEKYGGDGVWKKLGCYVLVERFVVRRMDGSLVMKYCFKHSHLIRSIWE